MDSPSQAVYFDTSLLDVRWASETRTHRPKCALHMREGGRSIAPLSERLGLAPAACDGYLTGTHHLDQAERPYHALERLYLLGGARHLDDHRALGDIHDLAAEDLGDLHQLAALGPVGGDLEQGKLARHRIAGLEVPDLQHVH